MSKTRMLTRVAVWTGAGLAGLSVLSVIAAGVITPIANRAPSDDSPIAVAVYLLIALAALAMIGCAAVFACLAAVAALMAFWHSRRRPRGEEHGRPQRS